MARVTDAFALTFELIVLTAVRILAIITMVRRNVDRISGIIFLFIAP